MGADRLPEFFSAIEECERRHPVSRWRVSGVPVWPLVRIEGRAELAHVPLGDEKRKSRLLHIGELLRDVASPVLDPLENYSDWRHERLNLRPVDALFLGDGISQDFISGVWRDRYCAPLIEALEANGGSGLLMQPRPQRLARERETYSVRRIASWGRLLAHTQRPRDVELPHYDDVRKLLQERGFNFNILNLEVLKRSGAKIAAMTRLFEHVLSKTQPKIGFVVSYYWDVGFAFNHACRRRGVLSVDVQHGSQDGRHEAYNLWSAVPGDGYSTLPAVFWTWSEEDAKAINTWAGRLDEPWHVGIWGGHPQLAIWLDDAAPQTREFDTTIAGIKNHNEGAFDILVALQDLEGYGAVWDRLADLIDLSPPHWRWWLRRHPVPAFDRGTGIRKLLTLKRRNIIEQEATSLPMPALLRNVDAVLSLMSSTAVEACYFGHRPIFLTEDARAQFSEIFKADRADVISDTEALMVRLAELERGGGRAQRQYQRTDLKQTVCKLLSMSQNHRSIFTDNAAKN